MSQFFASGGQSIRVSASSSVLPMNIQVWFPLGWTGWISLQSMGLSRVFSNTTVQKHLIQSVCLILYWGLILWQSLTKGNIGDLLEFNHICGFSSCLRLVRLCLTSGGPCKLTHRLTVAGEACSRSAGSKIRLILGLIWIISPLIKHSWKYKAEG